MAERYKGPFGLNPATTKGGAALQSSLKALEGLGYVLSLIHI